MADAKAKAQDPALEKEEVPISEALQKELDEMTTTQRAAVITLLLGEQQAADIFATSIPVKFSRWVARWSV